MSVEIERKFLVRNASWRGQVIESVHLRQGYLANTPACSIRVRMTPGHGWLSIKGMQPGRARPEYEYDILESDATEMLAEFVDGPSIEKFRHQVPVGRHRFEVDEFHGGNEGLVLAEIELRAVDEEFSRPPWLGDEVTDDARYYNFRLASEPFNAWPEAERRAALMGRRSARDAR
ncbi:MAG: CYTH domain-containing protein [Woeseiaceae bacterium]